MESLGEQFSSCLSRWIKIVFEPAAAAHKEVRAVLEADSGLKRWGVDTILIGSYARDVSIFPCKDVDVFVKLPDCPETDPEKVFSAVQRPLTAHYKTRATEQRRSMVITGFQDDLCVDAVPAVRDGARWKIPQTDSARVKNRWEITDPETLTSLARDRHGKSPIVDGNGSYKPTVRLIRQIRSHHLGDVKPGGLYLELLTFHAFTTSISGSSHAEILSETLERVAAQLENGGVAIDPALGAPFAPAPERVDMLRARQVFRSLAGEARAALAMNKCPAAAAWRKILGRNPRGHVFPLPDGCDETGKEVVVVTSNRDRGSDEARPFAYC